MARLDERVGGSPAGGPERGFSLLEALLALAITLVVMGMVALTMSRAASIYEVQSDIAVGEGAATLALDDVLYELSLAGHGLGEGVPAVLPRIGASRASDAVLTIRSNPDVLAADLLGMLDASSEGRPEVAASATEDFEKGASALLTNVSGATELVEIVKVEPGSLALRSLESSDGSLRRGLSPGRGPRLLGAREVRYYLGEPGANGRREMVKEVVGVGRRILTRDVLSLSFEYRDGDDAPLSLASVESSGEVASVRVELVAHPGRAPLPLVLASRVALDPPSGTVDFEIPGPGLRLSRVFYPIDAPAGVASRAGSDVAVILASGNNPTSDPAYLYKFEMETRFLSASVDEVVWLGDVRAPIALAFGPENGPLAGSLFVAAWGLRIGHLSRVVPDASGGLSASSEAVTFEGTEAVAQAGGIAFGADDALYVASREKGALYRFRFAASGEPGKPERMFRVTGTPGALVEGADGHLYFLMNHLDRGSLWKMPFDENLEPQKPVEIGPLGGSAVSLALDPISGSLYALVQRGTEEFVLVELDRGFLRGLAAESEPPVVFSLRDWIRELEEGTIDPRTIPFPTQQLPEKLAYLRVDALDSVSFDALGSAYLASREGNLVLKFELERPSGRYAVGLAAGVVDRGAELAPSIRMHAWKKSPAGR